MKYSFILEIDDISKDDINELISVLSDNKIKFHVLKSDKELKENQKYKEVIKEINILCDDFTYNCSASGIEVVHKIRNILKEVEHEKSND